MTTAIIARTSNKTREVQAQLQRCEDERQATTAAAEQAAELAEYEAWKKANGLPDRLSRQAYVLEFGLADDYAGIGCY